MGIFGKKKVVDLTETYGRRRPARAFQQQASSSSASEYGSDTVGYLGEMVGAAQPSESSYDENPDEKKKKLAKRIIEMTERIEDLSNQIYHLQQRIDFLERKISGRTEY